MYGTPLRFSISSAARYSSAFSGVVRSCRSSCVVTKEQPPGTAPLRGLDERRCGRRRDGRRDLFARTVQRQFDDEEGWPIGIGARQERHRDVVDGDAGARAPLQRSAMRVTVENRADAASIDRLLEAAGSEIGKDLRRLTHEGAADQRVVQDSDALLRPKPRERGLELQRLVELPLNEGHDRMLAPGPEPA